MNLKENIEKLPMCNGIYIMKNKYDHILYIGKSKHIKKRVKTYFYKGEKTNKLEKLTKEVCKIDHIKTDTEIEALLLECEMIKKHKPPYNRLLKNHEKYCYFTIDKGKSKMKVTFDKEEISFGPYKDRYMIEDIISFFQRVYPIKYDEEKNIYDFKYNIIPNRMNNEKHIKDHMDNVEKIFKDHMEIFGNILKEKMISHAKKMEFERANIYKKAIEILDYAKRMNELEGLLNDRYFIATEEICEDKIKVLVIGNSDLLYRKIYYKKENYENEIMDHIKNKLDKNNKVPIEKENIDRILILKEYLRKKENINEIKMP
ncbi:GIY-YIG nuclease family protein [Anaeromicrobium sediminis]|uniref:GIY-YIG domain-containing protein n=1 Tax=Anaeromicrobium sediminis TaxID=1478221 RepID=A0A267MHH7_9FIRM|nr:GIY-YIG nuclease family protein [Anaeromicrobium sediminis]PAB59019.1 hypothetical protein CCE28_12615 [Anaeromicrobium sediminis]